MGKGPPCGKWFDKLTTGTAETAEELPWGETAEEFSFDASAESSNNAAYSILFIVTFVIASPGTTQVQSG